jgi:hypothetical protein
MPDIVPLPPDYAVWLAELKTQIHGAQQRATLAVSRELVQEVLAQLPWYHQIALLDKLADDSATEDV